MKKSILAGIILFFLLVGFLFFYPTTSNPESDNNKKANYEYYYDNENTEEDSSLSGELDPATTENKIFPLDTVPDSITVLVNRAYLLPDDYVPAQLVVPNVKFNFTYLSDKRKLRKVAADALEKLFEAAEKEQVILYGVSGYRSYARQKQIYDRNIAIRGQAATDAVSAQPGSSEHQTGLTIDVSAQSVNYRLDQSFGDTKEGKWLAKHAHEYGFVIRYPLGKTEVTGYSYEPWHIRYLGKKVATYLYDHNLTLEEYYGVEDALANQPSSRVDVEDPDTVTYATPKPTITPKKTDSPKKTKKPKPTQKTANKPKTTVSPVITEAPTEKPVMTAAPLVPDTPSSTLPPTPVPTPVPTDPPVITEPPEPTPAATTQP